MAEAVSGLTGSLQGTITGLGNRGMQWLDTVFPPESRAKAMNAITKFCSEKPMLASFLASQIALSGFPLGLFVVMTISIAIFAVLVALILAVLGSVLFILFFAGVALIFLLPTLFVTTAIATFVWLWGLGTYYILKRFNKKPIPGIHTSLKDGLIDNLGADNEITHQLADLTGQKIEGGGEEKGAGERKEIEDAQVKKKQGGGGGGGGGAGGDKKKTEAAAAGGGGGGGGGADGGGMNGHTPDPKKAADVGKHVGKATDTASGVKDKASGATGAANGVKDKASGATGTVTGVAGGAKGALGV